MVWRFTILPAHCIMCQLSHVRHSAAGRKKKQNGLVVLDCWFCFSFLAYCAMQSYWLTHFILTPLSCVGDEIEWSRLVMNYKAPFKVYSPSPAPRSLSLSLPSTFFKASLQAHQRARSGTRDARGGGWTGVMNKSYKLSNLKTTNDYRLFDAGSFDPFLEHV